MKMKTALETKKAPLVCVLIISFGFLSILKSISGVTSETEKQNFELAESESGGFFTDVSSYHWNLMKAKVKAMSPNYNPEAPPFPEGGKIDPRNREDGWFYQNHFEPDFVCQHERRIGKLGDGGKWVCDPHRITQKSSCLVYSVGSSNDFSFEESVQTDIGSHCEIHTFDFGDYKEGAEKAGVHYHQVGLGVDSIEGDKVFKSLSTIVQELGHEGRTIDIFKIDCEACEWTTASEWFKANVELKQIQVELHNSKIPETGDFFKSLYANHYVITHKEPNVISLEKYRVLAVEYAFLKLTAQFFD